MFGATEGCLEDVGGKREMGIRAMDGDEVGLEVSDVGVEGTIETEGGSEGGYNLSDEMVEGGVGRARCRA